MSSKKQESAKKQMDVPDEKAVVAATSNEVVAAPDMTGMPVFDIGAGDIKIDRILLMQKMSVAVEEEKAKVGAFVIASTNEQLAIKEESSLEFIIVDMVKYWITKDEDTKEFVSRTPALTPEEKPWKETVGGKNLINMYTLAYYVILPKHIEGMEDIPFELAFRSTQLDAAKSMNTKLVNMMRRGVKPWDKVFSVKAVKKTKGTNTWYVPQDAIGRDTTPEERKIAAEWYKQVGKLVTKEENDDIESYTRTPSHPVNEADMEY